MKTRTLRIVNSVQYFWKSAHTEKIDKALIKYITIYRGVIYNGIVFVIWVPIIILRRYPFQALYPELKYSYEIFGMMQLTQYSYDTLVLTASDCFFLGSAFLLYGQFLALNHKLSNIGGATAAQMHKDIRSCIQHHKLLLQFV